MKAFKYLLFIFIIISCKDQSPTNVFTPIATTNISSFEIQNPIENDTILYFNNFKSSYVDQRQLEIWLPQGYPLTGVDYKLLYMHDGQN
ncbi:MAG: hypothetical protein ABJH73_06370, partial [Nonlabens ulvanivorans]